MFTAIRKGILRLLATKYEGWETVIGLEIHVELATRTKMFCDCKNRADATPNTLTCPVCAGLPGAMPTVNREAVRLARIAGDALNCREHQISSFDRKHFFYPDLPKGYQITQYYHPLCERGILAYRVGREKKTLRITRIHMEEDAGKLIHENGKTLLDMNRCGVPLIEIVTEPELRTPQEAAAAFRAIRNLLKFTGVTVGHMNEGHLRCDVNLSVHRVGEPFGVRCEIKNLNSFSSVEKACLAEMDRQITLIELGEPIDRWTMRFDGERTHPLRPKETPEDYRYMPEPDLPELVLGDWQLRRSMTPWEWAEHWETLYGLKYDVSDKLTHSLPCALMFDRAAFRLQGRQVKLLAGLITEELAALCGGITDEDEFFTPVDFERISEIAILWDRGDINATTAKKLVGALVDGEQRGMEDYCREEGLLILRDENLLRQLARETVQQEVSLADQYRGGKTKVLQALLGKAMGRARGRADAGILERVLREVLNEN